MEHNDSLFKRIKEGIYDMCYIYVREMKNVFHDQGVLLFFIIAPLFYPLIYAWIYNNEVVRDVPVAAVDLEHSHLSREYLRLCDASPDVKIISHCNSLDDAKELVEKQIVSGIILIPNDFQKNLNRMEQSHINVYCDMSLLMARQIYRWAGEERQTAETLAERIRELLWEKAPL
ncbi:MAG: ABC transporter permease, partial [Prevotella sp.]|nr:ABC transporter permease [Prevotella sp.]